MSIDLHTHSTASDGTLSPTELIHLAKAAHLDAVALTDHDTVLGLAEASDAAARGQIEFLAGVELSAELAGGVLHIVGLLIDPANTALNEKLNWAVESRRRRNQSVSERLADLGLPIDYVHLTEMAPDGVLGRPHFARYLVQIGAVSGFEAAFKKLLNRGRPAYVPREKLSASAVIAAIRAAGGVPILAHPDQTNRRGRAFGSLLRGLIDDGLVGLEVYCTGYTDGDIQRYRRLAKDFGLLLSGGSDFHGAIKPGIALGHGTGRLCVPSELLQPIRQAAERIQKFG